MNNNERLKDELRKRNSERLRESIFQNEVSNQSELNNSRVSNNEVKLNDIKIDDAKLDSKISLKPENNVQNSDINNNNNINSPTTNDINNSSNLGSSERLHSNDKEETKDPKNESLSETDNKSNEINNSSNELENNTSNESNHLNNQDDMIDTSDDFNETPKEKKKLKDRINDTKEKAKKAKEKANQAKEKVNQAKEKTKNAWNNRPKNTDDLKQRVKNKAANTKEKASGLKDRLKQGIKNTANKAKEKAKDNIKKSAKETYDNSRIGQAIKKGKKTVENVKKTVKIVKTLASTAYIWGPIVLVIIGMFLITSLMIIYIPGIGGDINNEENISSYTEVDQKTLDKLKKLFESYPTADGTLAMIVVSYPYFDILHSGNVKSYLTNSYESSEGEKESREDLVGEDDENIESEEDDKTRVDDIYLIPFRNATVRFRLKKVLEKLEEVDDEGFKSYLIDEYFKSDGGFTIGYQKDVLTGYNGYKKLFNAIDKDENLSSLEQLVIKDLYNKKDMFINYVYKNAVCATSLVDAGNVEVDEMLKGTILVDVKVDSCKDEKISTCDSWYSSPIDLGEYVKGVVWTEMSVYEGINIEKVKAQMVAAKSYVLGRYKTMGWELKQTEDGSYVVPIRSNTNDQDYCDYNEGCINKSSGNKHGAANESQKAILNEAWDATKDLYIYNNNSKETTGAYCADRSKTSSYDCSWCTKGNCLSQSEVEKLQDNGGYTVETILSEHYSNLSMVKIEGNVASAKTVGQLICTNRNSNMTAKRNQLASAAISYASRIPYYEGGLANSKNFEENNFGSEITPDAEGRTKKGLSSVGFINFVYWNIVDNNFNNEDNIENIINDDVTYSITKEQLLVGDIGYSSDKSIIGIYLGNENWAVEDPTEGNVVSKPDSRLTVYRRLNIFKDETYNYTIRTTAPTLSEWKNMDNLYNPGGIYVCQCVWYAKNRAIEIINELYNNGSLTEKEYDRHIKRIKDIKGNGNQYHLGGTVGKVITSGSNNIEDYKSGSFIGMKSWYSSAGKKYGHVVIIEYANRDENKIITTDGSRKGFCSSNNYGGLKFNYEEYTYEEFYKRYNPNDSQFFDFYGYLYFLEG